MIISRILRITLSFASPVLFLVFSVNGFSDSSGELLKSNSNSGIQGEIRFYEEVVYEESGEIMFGNITTSAVDQAGRVLLGDNDQKMVHVMDGSGGYIQSFGSHGNGPGEFLMITKITAGKNYIHVFDLIQAKINLFDAERFRFIRTISLSDNGGVIQRGAEAGSGLGRPFDFHLLSDGNYLVLYRNFSNPSGIRAAKVSSTGEILEKDRFEFNRGDEAVAQATSGNTRVFANFPFSRSIGITVSPTGKLFSNWSGDFSFDLFDESGTHIRSFSHPHQAAQLNRSEVLKMFEDTGGGGTRVVVGNAGSGGGGAMPPVSQMLQNIELPETWPAVSSFYADKQNRLWVSSFTENISERDWYLFDDTGALAGTFTWPAGKTIVHADNSSVYVLVRDPEELDKVVRYRIVI